MSHWRRQTWVVECGGCHATAVVHREPPARGWYCSTACYQAFVARIREAGQQVLVGFEG